MIADAHIVQARRKATRPSRAAKAERVEKKKQRSAVKQGRGKVQLD
jgi:ribosome-associated protein